VSISERDYILRMIERLGAFLARIMGARRAGDLELARREVGAAMGALFGPLAEMVEKVDAESAASLLGDPEKIRAYASLLAERAAIDDSRADERRALMLLICAARKTPQERVSGPAREAILALAARVDRERLPEPYRRDLDAITSGSQA
jgi:hypothetical protein